MNGRELVFGDKSDDIAIGLDRYVPIDSSPRDPFAKVTARQIGGALTV